MLQSAPFGGLGSFMAGIGFEVDGPIEQVAPAELQPQEVPGKEGKLALPIFSIIPSIDFAHHFMIVGDVGTGKSTVVPIHEFELRGRVRQIIIREPSRAACNALYYSLMALHPE